MSLMTKNFQRDHISKFKILGASVAFMFERSMFGARHV